MRRMSEDGEDRGGVELSQLGTSFKENALQDKGITKQALQTLSGTGRRHRSARGRVVGAVSSAKEATSGSVWMNWHA